MSRNLLDRIEQGPVVFDGAMGTLLYTRGVFINRNFDELNLARPDMVEKIHQDYLEAGAHVLTTNTFGANTVKLSKHGLGERLDAINRAGVRLARSVAGDAALVIGSMGPTGILPDSSDPAVMERLRASFAEQADSLLSEGVDALLLETFRHPVEIAVALEVLRPLAGVPILASMVFDSEFRTGDGLLPEEAATLLASLGADIIGANCGEGPSVIHEVVSRMTGAGRPVIAQPNAGHPRRVEGRVIYMTTPEYFGEFTQRFLSAGVRLVGGCCGTTPSHVRQIAAEVRMVSGGRVSVDVLATPAEVREHPPVEPVPMAERSSLGRALQEGFVVSVEVDPPSGVDPSRAVEGARNLARAGVKFVNIADGPRATVRMSPMALALILVREAGIEPILHVTCRDRNLLGIQADLLGAHSLDLHNLLIITGDPSKLGDYPEAATVYDLDSVGLLRLVSNLNRGIEPSGRRLQGSTAFVKGCGAEPGASDFTREIDRLRRKVDAGAEFVMTQPVYDADVMGRFLDQAAGLGVPIIMGVLPLASHRNAEFLHHEVPGMSIPEPIRERMRSAGSGPSAREEGVSIAREIVKSFMDQVRGIYIMPPFDRYDTALAVLDGLSLPGSSHFLEASPGSP
jgi:homocysteine S-methyltransferase